MPVCFIASYSNKSLLVTIRRMKPIYQMWKMVDLLRETEASRYNDSVENHIIELQKKGVLGELNIAERRKQNVKIKLGGDIEKGATRKLLLESFLDRYHDGVGSTRKYGNNDKIGTIKVDWEKDTLIHKDLGEADVLLEQCINADFIVPNKRDNNLVSTTDKGLSFTNPLWGSTHWRTRGRFYGISLGLVTEYIKELETVWKVIFFILGFVVASLLTNWFHLWNVVGNFTSNFLYNFIPF